MKATGGRATLDERYFHTELNETLAAPLSYIRKIGRAAMPVRHAESKYIADVSACTSDEKVERKLPMHLAYLRRSVRVSLRTGFAVNGPNRGANEFFTRLPRFAD